MYTNTPDPNLYRIAELRHREDLATAARRRHELFSVPRVSRVTQLRGQLGSMLILLGNRIMQAPASEPQVEHRATI